MWINFLFNKLITILIFFFLLLIGLNSFDDFGIGIDEDNSRINGYVTLNYIYDLLGLEKTNILANLELKDINQYEEQGNGVVFDLSLVFFENYFNITDFRDQFLLRHFVSFLLFFSSLIYFYKIILLKNNSKFLAIFGVLFLFFSPRIFAHSFVNPKDIGFMSIGIINLFYGIKYLQKPDIKNSLIFTIVSGILVGFRLTGLFIPLIIILISWIDNLRNLNKKKSKYIPLLLIVFLLPISIFIFWPFLWASPINNFIYAFDILSNHYRPIYNLFLGEYISALNVPWHYILTWIFFSTPLLYLFFFFIGLFLIFKRLIKRLINIKENSYNDLWRGENEKFDLIFFLIILIPILIVIILHSSLYTGWRHLFFIYPSIILISIHGIYLMKILYFKYKNYVLNIVILFLLSPIIYWMISNHPYQYSFFNYFERKMKLKFENDYWGISIYNSLNYLASNNDGQIKIYLLGDGDLNQSKFFLKKELRNKILVQNSLKDSEFAIDNFNRWDGILNLKDSEYIQENFKNYHEIKIDDKVITRVYKRILNN